jgi:hypothetical protein
MQQIQRVAAAKTAAKEKEIAIIFYIYTRNFEGRV